MTGYSFPAQSGDRLLIPRKAVFQSGESKAVTGGQSGDRLLVRKAVTGYSFPKQSRKAVTGYSFPRLLISRARVPGQGPSFDPTRWAMVVT